MAPCAARSKCCRRAPRPRQRTGVQRVSASTGRADGGRGDAQLFSASQPAVICGPLHHMRCPDMHDGRFYYMFTCAPQLKYTKSTRGVRCAEFRSMILQNAVPPRLLCTHICAMLKRQAHARVVTECRREDQRRLAIRVCHVGCRVMVVEEPTDLCRVAVASGIAQQRRVRPFPWQRWLRRWRWLRLQRRRLLQQV